MEKSNRIDPEVKELLTRNKIMIMRDKKTLKPLGINFTEDGLRGIANKNGVYLYCEGRVTNYNTARKARKSPNVIVERFIPRDFNHQGMATAEIHWANYAKHLIAGK